jgi:hypothetical protein
MKKLYLISYRLISFLLILMFVFMKFNGFSQLSVTTASTNYTINFETTVAGVNNGQYAGTGLEPTPVTGRLDSDAWATSGMSDGNSTFGDTRTTSATDFTRGTSTGSTTQGGYWSFQVATGDYAFGIQPTDPDWTPGTVVLKIVNNTGGTVNSVSISYNIYNKNDGNRANSFNFAYSYDNTTYTTVPSLDYTSPEALSTPSPWTAIARSTTITGLTLSNGSFFYFRWNGNEVTGTGSRDKFALNDIVINVTTAAGIADPSAFDAAPFSTSQVNLTWGLNASSDSVMVAHNTSKTFGTPGGVYAIGAPISGGGTVLYYRTGTDTSHTSLTFNTKYYYKAWSKSAAGIYSPGIVDSATTYKIEPSNYPTDFTVTGAGITITASWTDATGVQIPDAYLVKISSQDNITAPADGTPVADDINITDGSGTLNVNYGAQAFSFFRLLETTVYYVKIYPYTNVGAAIDYKTDGTAPAGYDTTQIIINTKDFENSAFSPWTTYNVASTFNWTLFLGTGAYGTTHYTNINGYNTAGNLSNDWLISPSLNFDPFTNEKIVFFSSYNFPGPDDELKLKYSTDYVSGDPTIDATWTELTFTKPTSILTWVPSGIIDLSSISGTNIHFAFQYLNASSTVTHSWSVDEIEITGWAVPSPSNFDAVVLNDSQVDLSWILNVTGDDVIIAYNSTNEFGIPENGYNYILDDAISGGGTVMYNGNGTATSHTGLTGNTKYYYMAWSKTATYQYSLGVNDSATTYKSEPLNYPADFTVTPIGITVTADWTDATGDQLPDGYVVMISNQDNITPPVDGTPVADDLNLTDGAGAMNVAFGDGTFTFFRLGESTNYYLKIYPYTNSGAAINYKTDGEVPAGNAITQIIINANDFETNTFGTWSTISVASNKNWTVLTGTGAYGTAKYSNINGLSGDVASNDWLISPGLNLDAYTGEYIVFFTSWNNSTITDELKLKYSRDYVSGDPTLVAWTELTFSKSAVALTWKQSGFIDLSSITGENVHIAFQYLSTSTTDTRSWSVDEIEISGEGVSDPTNLNATTFSASQIDLTWVKNINNDDVMIAWNSTNTFGTPTGNIPEGEPIPGGGTVIYRGPEQLYSHMGLNQATTYYYKAWSVNPLNVYSSGVTDNATTSYAEPTNHPTEFTATSNGPLHINVSWIDCDAAHYLIKGSSVGYSSIHPPIDGVGQGDSLLVRNVNASVQAFQFSGLVPNTTYYFKIFPYNGIGESSNYKIDGDVPQTSATTGAAYLDLIITEVTHPKDAGLANAKFVEIMNTGTTTIDFSSIPVYLSKQSNGGATWGDIQLTGIIGPGETYVIGNNNTSFFSGYGISADLYSTLLDGNGNDGYFLFYGGTHITGYIFDAYGVINQDGSGKGWDYTTKKAVRKRNISVPNITWTASEWVILPVFAYVKDMTPDYHKGTVTWQGSISTNWNAKGLNWDSPNGYIPDASCNVIIPFTDVTNFPIVTEQSAINQVEIESGATLSIQSPGSLLIVGQ